MMTTHDVDGCILLQPHILPRLGSCAGSRIMHNASINLLLLSSFAISYHLQPRKLGNEIKWILTDLETHPHLHL
jgi:hypothetical protein